MAKKVSFGPLSATLTLLKSGTLAGKWRITYRDRDGVRRIGGTLATEKVAKARALEILRDLDASNNLGQLTRDEEALIFAIREAGVPPQALLPSLKDLKEVETILLADAIDTFITKNVEDADYSYEQRKDYLRVLNELRRHFGPIELSSVTPAEIEKWTDSWEVSAKRHNNKRSLLVSFWNWAVSKGFAAKNNAESITRKRVPKKSAHEVLTPREFAVLLAACPETHLPWLTFSGFGGLRGVEIYGRPNDRESGLRWEDVDWERGAIILQHHSVKRTRASRARMIPISEGLRDWIEPFSKNSGLVYDPGLPVPNGGNPAMTVELGKLIGGWKSNALRASRASYRLAETQNVSTVTLEMGHTQDMLIGQYLNPRFEADAKLWFSLTRDAVEKLLKQN